MKYYFLKKTMIVAAVMAATFVLSGCGSNNENVTETVTFSVEDTSVSNDTSLVSDNNIAVEGNVDNSPESVASVDLSDDSQPVGEAADAPIVSSNTTDEQVTTSASPAPVSQGTPLSIHGELSVNGTTLVDKSGKAFQLKGVSTHGITWFPEYVNRDAFKTMRDEWGVNCVRLAMYTAEYNGYCSGGNQSDLKNIVDNGVNYATDLGMYVIIDWHILSDNDPTINQAQAIAFFDEMSKKYADYDNVIYEICNEPNGGTSWATIKAYAEKVIPVIKANNKDAIIIVGTPTWSQDVDQAAANPIKGYSNIMYTLHFYADTHKDDLRNKMVSAINAGLPIIVTEFGACDASGNGNVNIAEANKWISLLDSKSVSYCIWNLSNKAESSSLIVSGCSKTSGWTQSDLSEEGRWYVGVLGGNATGATAPSSSTNSTNNSSNNNNNNNASAQNAVTASSSNTQVTLAQSGGWDGQNGKNYQYTVTIKNTGSSTINGWALSVDFGQNVSLDQSWNGNYTKNGNVISITPVDFNKQIGQGASVEVGFIVSSPSAISNPSVKIN